MSSYKKIQQAAAYIDQQCQTRPTVGLILGSGLGIMADNIEATCAIAYADIPHFPITTVAGHEGQLILGKLEGKVVVAMQGRIHYYEGYTMQEVSFPVRVMAALGITTLVITNACGGLNPRFYPGALMLIRDHINMMGDNPLIGQNDDRLGPRFPDMSRPYSPKLMELARKTARKNKLLLLDGVLAAIAGPYYMSNAELKMLQILGADAVGMSTIPEVLVANHQGLEVLGISCVTDMAVPDQAHDPVSHDKVMAVATAVRPKFEALVRGIIAKIPNKSGAEDF